MAIDKQKKSETIRGYEKPIISDTVKSHANDPFVLNKVAKAKDFLIKHPIPEHLLKNNIIRSKIKDFPLSVLGARL